MLIDGLKLMVVGMGTVFLFLALMVLTISIAAKILAPFAGVLEPKTEPARPSQGRKSERESLVAAITAAVAAYRDEYERDDA